MANIHFDVTAALIKHPGFLSKQDFILSGLLRSEARNLMHMLSALPVRIIETWDFENTWYTLRGVSENEEA